MSERRCVSLATLILAIAGCGSDRPFADGVAPTEMSPGASSSTATSPGQQPTPDDMPSSFDAMGDLSGSGGEAGLSGGDAPGGDTEAGPSNGLPVDGAGAAPDADTGGGQAPPSPTEPALLTSATPRADLGRTEVGTRGAVFSWVIQNDGPGSTGPLSLSGGSADFDLQNGCSNGLPPGSTCVIAITFTPQDGGDRTSELVLGDGTTSVRLSLTGRALVRITVALDGVGRVTGAGIDCGNTCSVVADIGDSLLLEASTTNGSGAFFSGWSHEGCEGPARTCPIVVGGAETVTARFAPMNNNLIFVSSETFPSTLGGVVSYDEQCNRLASAAGINNVAGDGYVAFMRDAATSLPSRVPVGVSGWVRLDAKPFTTTLDALFGSNVILNPIVFDEQGQQANELLEVFTGMNSDGTATDDCEGWTSGAAGGAQTGFQAGGPGAWASAAQEGCDGEPRHIYCAGVERTAPLAVPRAEGKLIWVTPPLFAPGAGADPDALCSETRPSTVSAATALISRTSRAASESLDLRSLYVRPDGQPVGTGEQLIAADGFLQSGIWQSGEGVYLPNDADGLAGVLTGALNPTSVGLVGDTCNDWSDAAGTRINGISNLASGDWWFRGDGGACSATTTAGFSIYCVEL
jgi:hypothetical protein